MSGMFVGCSDLPRDRRNLYGKVSAVEHRVGLFSPPKSRVLKGWAEEARGAGHPVRTVWTAWQAFTHRPGEIRKGFGLKLLEGEQAGNVGHFMDTSENRRVWSRILEQAGNVGASHILLETPAGFTPSAENRRALYAFARDWSVADGFVLVWHPAGFWEREDAAGVASDLGMVLAVDPLVDVREPLPSGSSAYFQMLGRHGLMDSYSDDDMERILDAASGYDDVTVVFRTVDSLGDTRRLIRASETYEPDGASFADAELFDDDGDFDDEEEDGLGDGDWDPDEDVE